MRSRIHSHQSHTGANQHSGRIRLIDIGLALDLLAAAVAEYGHRFVYPPVGDHEQECAYQLQSHSLTLVGRALSIAGVSPGDLECLHRHGVRDLHARGRLPIPLTLGAAVVLDAAERSQDRGLAWGEAAEHARRAAVGFVTLLPDRALDGAFETAAAHEARSFEARYQPAVLPDNPGR